MGTRIPRHVTRAMRSVVVVTDKERGGDYCSGFVIEQFRRDAENMPKTLVVAPTAFVKGKEGLWVSFFDKVQLPAALVREESTFSLLSTAAHPKCEAVRLLEDFNPLSFLPRPTFVVPPISSTKTCYVPTYATLESLESYSLEDVSCLESSRNYFLITCDHPSKTHSGTNRLVAAPVFINERTSLSGLAMGFLLQVTHIHNDLMMVGVTSTYFKKILKKLDPPPARQQRRGMDGQKRQNCGQKRKRFN